MNNREAINVAFYLENYSIPNADFRNPESGNPGVGGTEFLFSAIIHYLKIYADQKIHINFTLLANHTKLLQKNLDVVKVDNLIDCIRLNIGFDIIVFRPRRNIDHELIESIKNSKIKFILWLHVTPTFEYLRMLASLENVKAIVCVEAEQHDLIFDMPNRHKLTYIVNGFDFDGFVSDVPDIIQREKSVVYLGAMVYAKGFHRLARIWPEILKRVPDAKLNVIGSGSLYSENAQLGSLGIADATYEDQYLAPYLTDSMGKLLDSVVLFGKLGSEKKKIIKSAAVAVPNPTAQGENCPGVCLEIQSLGTPIVTAGRFGMLDTVLQGHGGKLVNNDQDMIDAIVGFLQTNRPNYNQPSSELKNFIVSRYGYDVVSKEWNSLFASVYNDNPIKLYPMKRNLFHEGKFLIRFNSAIRNLLPKCINLPMIGEYKVFAKDLYRNMFL